MGFAALSSAASRLANKTPPYKVPERSATRDRCEANLAGQYKPVIHPRTLVPSSRGFAASQTVRASRITNKTPLENDRCEPNLARQHLRVKEGPWCRKTELGVRSADSNRSHPSHSATQLTVHDGVQHLRPLLQRSAIASSQRSSTIPPPRGHCAHVPPSCQVTSKPIVGAWTEPWPQKSRVVTLYI